MFKLTRIRLVAGIAMTAAAFPAAAQARVAFDPPAGGSVATPVQVPAPSAPASESNAFQWGDAGIGAGGTAVLLGAGAVAASAARRRRGSHRAIAG